ncbi:competence protein ComEC [Entomoplasma ellychniae]|uniref:Competence protein ComEC n=1 Tax=Entomoplasma ellychniae TaxID=2114 RepID=A0A8E2QYC1_9MOLU|nr:competence protein ComEC [Entomoplasma ellychniae]
MKKTTHFCLKKELVKLFHSNVWKAIFLLISVFCFNIFIFNNSFYFLVIWIVTFIGYLTIGENKIKSLFVFLLPVFIFFILFKIKSVSYADNTKIEGIGKIKQVKDSYIVIGWNSFDFYLSKPKVVDLKIGDQFKFDGVVKKLVSNSNYYEFDFVKFLNKKFVFYELKVSDIKKVESKNLKTVIFWLFNRVSFSDLTRFFWLPEKFKSKELNNLLIKNNISYISNSCILLLIPLINLSFKKTKNKLFNFKNIILTVIALVIYLQLENVLLLRILIFWILKSLYKNKSNKSLNLLTIYLMICLKPNYIFSTGFIYISVIYTLSCFLPKKNKKYLNFIFFYFLFMGLNMYFNYNINPMTNFIALILIPIFNIFAVCSLIFDGIGVNNNALYLSLFRLVSWITKFGINFNIGKIEIWFILTYMIVLTVLFNKQLLDVKTNIISFITIILAISLLYLLKPNHNLAMLNVGNANSFVYHNKWNNVTIIFDAGTGKNKSTELVTSFLKYYGINKIDMIAISHYHEDHYNNLSSLQENFKINLFVNKDNFKEVYKIKNVIIRFFNDPSASSENNQSIIPFIDVGNFRALFMGDAEQPTENHLMHRIDFINYLNLKRVDLLQVGHHGSKTSSSLEFLKFINPKNAFISGTDEGGNKIFPHKQTIDNLNFLKIPYFITQSKNNWFFNILSKSITKK